MSDRRCLWPACETPAESVCPEHWKVLPANIRDELTRAMRGGNGAETLGLRRAVGNAQAWIMATFDAGGRAGPRPAYGQLRLIRDDE